MKDLSCVSLTLLPNASVSCNKSKSHHLGPGAIDLQLLQFWVLLYVFLSRFGLRISQRTRSSGKNGQARSSSKTTEQSSVAECREKSRSQAVQNGVILARLDNKQSLKVRGPITKTDSKEVKEATSITRTLMIHKTTLNSFNRHGNMPLQYKGGVIRQITLVLQKSNIC